MFQNGISSLGGWEVPRLLFGGDLGLWGGAIYLVPDN